MSTNSTLTKHYRLEVRLGRMGWRCHARGPGGIEWTSPLPFESRDDALEEGRATLRAAGLDAWDEWMDGVTDNFFDPRAQRQLVVDAVAEAKRAGVDPPNLEAQAEATRKLRELEQRRAAATAEARDRALAAPPDVGAGVDGGPPEKGTAAKPASPLKAQRQKSAAAKEEKGA